MKRRWAALATLPVLAALGGCTIDEGLPPGATGGVAAEINDHGTITGWTPTLYGIRGFLKSPDGVFTDLGKLGDASTLPEALNNSNVVVGALWVNIYGTTFHHPFRWDAGGGLVDLGSFGGASGEATDNNDAGTIVGWSTYPAVNGQPERMQAWVWEPAGHTMTPLPNPPGNPPTYAAGINDVGDIVGWSYPQPNVPHALLWKAGTHEIVDIGPPGVASEAHDVNHAGAVAGLVRPSNVESRPTLWHAGTHTIEYATLGGNFGCANVINDNGVLAGSDYTAPDKGSAQHAFRWDSNTGQMVDLGTLEGHTASHAAGINEAGVAVGWSLDANGVDHIVRWAL